MIKVWNRRRTCELLRVPTNPFWDKGKFVLISISDTEDEGKLNPLIDGGEVFATWTGDVEEEFVDNRLVLEEAGLVDAIFVGFDDALPGDPMGELELMSIEQARKIVHFVNKHRDKNFLIHCNAGISRSGAVGMFLSSAFDDEDIREEFLTLHPHIHPNSHVKNTLRAAWQEINNEIVF